LKTVGSNVKVKEIYNLMITSLEQDIKKGRTNVLKSDLNKYFIDRSKIKEYPKRSWFKGSRYR